MLAISDDELPRRLAEDIPGCASMPPLSRPKRRSRSSRRHRMRPPGARSCLGLRTGGGDPESVQFCTDRCP
jgi:hypothetical protein